MVFQIHKVIILMLVIFFLTNIVSSYQHEDQNQTHNQTHNCVQIEQIELIKKSHIVLFQHRTLFIVMCLLFINR